MKISRETLCERNVEEQRAKYAWCAKPGAITLTWFAELSRALRLSRPALPLCAAHINM